MSIVSDERGGGRVASIDCRARFSASNVSPGRAERERAETYISSWRVNAVSAIINFHLERRERRERIPKVPNSKDSGKRRQTGKRERERETGK